MDSKLSNIGIEEYTFQEQNLLMNSNKNSMKFSIILEKLSIMILKKLKINKEKSDKNSLREEHTIKEKECCNITEEMERTPFHISSKREPGSTFEY